MLRLTYMDTTTIPVEAECITPNALAGKAPAEIAALPVQYGNAPAALGEFFRVEGDAGDQQILLDGDCARVKWIGAGMTSGHITVEGNVGMHVGAEMRGGAIDVKGNAGDWVGAEMRGGILQVRGDAGNLVGGGYRGSRLGMRGGAIFIHGKAGNEIASGMRRGLIAIKGDSGDFPGVSMIAGTLFLFGKPGVRIGAGMKRGTIALLGGPAPLLPSFRLDCVYQPVFLRLYFRTLRGLGFPVSEALAQGSYRRYSGDLVALGKGEILICE
jgi:formylmethanofuran dehydrogenase subunit C